MKNNKILKFLSTVLVAILIVTIAPVNDVVVSEMKSSANSVVKSIGEAVEKIDFDLHEFDVKANAVDIAAIPGSSLFPTPQKPFTYEIKRKKTTSTLTITCSGEMPSYYGDTAPWSIYKSYENLVIKGDVENIGGYAFKDFTKLKKVTIEAPIKILEHEAFYGCTSLTSVDLPDSLEKIYDRAFSGCSSLKTIKIPINVTSIGSSVFRGCPLKSLTVPFTGAGPDNAAKDASNELGYIFGTTEFNDSYQVESRTKNNTIYYVPNTLKTLTITDRLDSYGISNCGSIEKVVFAESLKTTYVPTYFARNADGLETIVFNSKIKTLAVNCFRECYNLRKVTLPEQLTIIGAYAFIQCENLESVVIGDNIQAINDSAFYNCKSLSKVEFPNKIFNVYPTSFEKTPWFDNLTDEFCTVGDSVLIKYNGTDTDIVIPDGIKAICGAFSGNVCVRTIDFPDSLKYIGSESFYGCNGIKDLYIPDTVEVIESGALYGLCWLRSLSLPFVGRTRDAKSLTKEAVFGYVFATNDTICNVCRTSMCTRDGQTYDGSNSFYYIHNSGLDKVTIRGGDIKSYAFEGFFIEEIILGENVPSIEAKSFIFANVNKFTLDCRISEIPDYAFKSIYSLKEIEIPSSVTKIGKAFADCIRLENVILNEGIKIIDGSFEGCLNLKNINLPQSLEKITGNAFAKCEDFSIVNLEKNVNTIDFEAFTFVDSFGYRRSYISEFNVNEENPFYFSRNGVLYTAQGELFIYPKKKTTEVFHIDADIVAINQNTAVNMIYVKEYTVDEENPSFTCVDGVLYNKDVTRVIKCPAERTSSYIAPESVTSVAPYAFYGYFSDKIEFKNPKVIFEERCFENSASTELIVGCFSENLDYYFKEPQRTVKKLVLTNQASSLAENFAYMWDLEEVDISGDFEKIGKYAFWSTEIKAIDLPESVQIIESGAFGYTKIEEIIFPENIKYIAANAFSYSTLKRVVLNESVLAVAEELFKKCINLEVVVIGGAVEEIEAKSFAECPSLRTVVIPDGVEKISQDAFENSTKNLTIYCNEDSYAESYAKENNIQYTTLVLDSIENQVYTGEEIRPVVGASANGKRLTLDSEYTIDYKNNINAGSAKIIARGLGDFKALIAVGKFTILPKEMENIRIVSQDSEFDMVKVDFNVDVFVDDVKLSEGVDYNLLTETKFCDVGENNVAVCGIGNYTGITNVIVNVVPRNIDKATIEVGDKIVITDKGEKLIENVEYTVTEEVDINGKKATLITGIANYDGFVVITEKEEFSNSFIDLLILFFQRVIQMLML